MSSVRKAFLLALLVITSRGLNAQTLQPTLSVDSLVAEVLLHNPGLESLQHAVAAARAREVPAGAFDDPVFGYAVAPRSVGADDLDTGHIVRIEQPLPWFGKRSSRRAAAQAESAREFASLESAQQQARLRARLLFADWYFVHEALAINRQQQRSLAELEETAEGLYRAGLGSQAGVLSASLRREQRAQEAIALQAQQRGLAARINALRNQPVDLAVGLPAELPEPLVPATLRGLVHALRMSNPELARLDAEQARAAQQTALAELDYRPDFRLTAQYLGTLPREENRGQIGVVLNIPIGRSKRDAAADAARADQARIAAQRVQRSNALEAELAAEYAALRSMLETAALYRSRLIPLAEQAHGAALADFAASDGSARAVVDAEDDLLQTRLSALRSNTSAYKHWSRLHWLAGPPPFEPAAQTHAQESSQ